ncbi:MAG: ATP-binding protein [Elusimicrobiota bacterium]
MYTRLIPLSSLIKRKSLFLLGPRQTGKSTLLKTQFPEAVYYDLLEADTFRELSKNPEYVRQTLPEKNHLLIVDEIQKLPSLLDEIQLLLDRNKSLRVILTGSSARKLKRGSANLLGGRAWFCSLHPLVSPELGNPRLLERMKKGGLPGIIDSPDFAEDLKAYVGTYLKEEIQSEGLTRSIGNFSRFLDVAGLSNGQQLNFNEVGNDAQVPPRTVREHYQILEDTLLGHTLLPYQKTKKRKPVATSKFYFFDLGVARLLQKLDDISKGSEPYGRALEHLIYLEMKCFLDYHRLDYPLTYWRSHSQFEVDFVIGNSWAVEVKSKNHVSESDAKGLLALAEECQLKRKLIVSHETRYRRLNSGVEVMPVEQFLTLLWAGKIIE